MGGSLHHEAHDGKIWADSGAEFSSQFIFGDNKVLFEAFMRGRGI